MLGQRYIDGLNSEFDNKLYVPVMSWYHYMYLLCPGTTICTCYVLVPLYVPVMSWYHYMYLLCPGTTICTCYVLVPLYLPVMSWYHYMYLLCPGTTICTCYVLVPLCVVPTFKQVSLQANPHKPIPLLYTVYM